MSTDAMAELWRRLDVGSSSYDLVAIGGELTREGLVEAYRHGVFPWPSATDREDSQMRRHYGRQLGRKVLDLGGQGWGLPWCSPDPRAVMLPDQVHVPRSLRQTLRRSGWTTTLDTAFEEVIDACAADRVTWITPQMREAYVDLHRTGVAHSVEVWAGEELVGGLYGVQSGGVFTGESMFHRATGASKAAVLDLLGRSRDGGLRLLDTQQESEHLLLLGQGLMRRSEFLQVLAALRDDPVVLPPGRREVTGAR